MTGQRETRAAARPRCSVAAFLVVAAAGYAPGCATPRPRGDVTSAPTTSAKADAEKAITVVERIVGLQAVRVTDQGRLLLVTRSSGDSVSLSLSVNRGRWARRGEAGPGDVVHVMADALGVGFTLYEILDVRADRVLMRENTFFGRDWERQPPRLLAVRPYHDPFSD